MGQILMTAWEGHECGGDGMAGRAPCPETAGQHNHPGQILVGIGANLPAPGGADPLETCRWAASRLAAVPGLRLVALSRWFRTRPVPDTGRQPDYVNGMAQLRGEMDPARLLLALQAIEAEAGRVRTVRNAARTLDLDIVAMGALVRDAPDPVVPHPRMHERAFVLAPLCDLLPGWRHPLLHRTARELLARGFPGQEAVPLSLRATAPATMSSD